MRLRHTAMFVFFTGLVVPGLVGVPAAAGRRQPQHPLVSDSVGAPRVPVGDTQQLAAPAHRDSGVQSTSASSSEDQQDDSERQEVVSERTRYAKVFEEPDGTYTAEIFTEQIHFKDAVGNWKEIDTTIVACNDGCAYRLRRGPLEVEFAGNGSASRLVTLLDGNRSLAFGLSGGARSDPVVEGDRITYPDVLPDTDLVFETAPTELKELIVLKAPPRSANSRWLDHRFPLAGTGLRATKTEDGDIELADDSGEVAFTIPRIIMYDSAIDPESGEPAVSESTTLDIEEKGGTQIIVARVDAEWLADPARVYPVTIDPPVTMTPSRDTFIQSNIVNTPQNTSDELKAGTYDGGSTKARSLIEFNIHSLKGTIIDTATLSVRNFHSWSCNTRPLEVRRVTSDWQWDVTWPNRPSLHWDPIAKKWFAYGYSSGCPAQRVEFNVKQAVQNWADLKWDNYGVALRATNETDNYGWKKFRSDNSSHPPKLIVSYNTPPKTPTKLAPINGTNNPDATPTLSGLYDDADNGDGGYLEFEVNPAGSPGTIVASGRGTFAERGQRSSWTVPSGALQEGVEYRWRARAFDHKHYSAWTDPRISYTVGDAAPGKPAISSTTHPDPDAWVAHDDPSFSWTEPDDPSGIQGYSYEINQNDDPNYQTDKFTDTTSNGRTASYTDVGDGEWYFHVRAQDGKGLWGDTAHYRVRIDDTSPDVASASSSSHPDPETWYSKSTIDFEWSADDTSGIVGYSYALDQPADETVDTTGTTTSYLNQSDGEHRFEVRAKNGSGLWGPAKSVTVRVDTSPASEPEVTSSTHPVEGTYYSADDVALAWASSDPHSGVVGYKFLLDQNATTDPSTAPLSTDTERRYDNLSEGIHYFHVKAKNGSGLWSSIRHFEIRVDSEGPDVSVTSSTHAKGSNGEVKWYSNNDPIFSWSASDASGINGYSWIRDQLSTTTPDDTLDGGARATSTSYTELGDGVHFFHIKGQNNAGAFGVPTHFEFRIDTQDPSPPTAVTSTSHVKYIAFDNREITTTWSPGSDQPALSGVAGYTWSFCACEDPANDPNFDDVAEPENETTATSGDQLEDGDYFFHVATVDNAGNVSLPVTYGPMVIRGDGLPINLSPTLDGVLVAQSDELGLEQFYPYRSSGLGGGSIAYTNLATGNLVVQKQDVRVPSIGLNTILRHTYNSRRADPLLRQSGTGRGWTLSISDLDSGVEGAENAINSLDVNSPILPAEFVNDQLAVAGFVIEFTDGDGTTHRFVRRCDNPGDTCAADGRWHSPPGVSLRVRAVSDGLGGVSAYELIRPDGVTYTARPVETKVAEQLGAVTFTPPTAWRIATIRDRNGNKLTFTHRAFGPKVTDVRAVSVAHDRYADPSATLSYDDNGNLTKITALPELPAAEQVDPATGAARDWTREIAFTINDKGSLTAITENSDVPADSRSRRRTKFSYRSEETLPGVFEERELLSLTDPRGETEAGRHQTDFGYGNDNGLQLETITDRRGNPWTFDYRVVNANTGETETTVTAPVTGAKTSTTTYRISGRGPISDIDKRRTGHNIVTITDAGNNAGAVTNSYVWQENRLIKKANGVGDTTQYSYNDLGLVTQIKEPPPNDPARSDLLSGAPQAGITTTLFYRAPPSGEFTRSNCTPLASSAGDPISNHGYCDSVLELIKATYASSHPGQARITDFDYDSDGNLTLVVANNNPDVSAAPDRRMELSYYDAGVLRRIDGPRAITPNDVTIFGSNDTTQPYGGYSRSGHPKKIKDALGQVKEMGYTPYGLVARVKDRRGSVSTTEYDDRDNPIRITDPAGDVTTSTYDDNDNRQSETSPRGNATATAGDFTTTFRYNANDWLVESDGPGTTEAERVVNRIDYFHDGTKSRETNPIGAVTTFSYYDNRQLEDVTTPAGSGDSAVTTHLFDRAGRLTAKLLPQSTASGARPRQEATYSPQGQLATMTAMSSTGELDRATRHAYNAHGEQIQVLGPRRNSAGATAEQRMFFNSFGETVEMRRRLSDSKTLNYLYDYDRAGNQIAMGQPGSEGTLTTNYRYDALDRLTFQNDPQNPGHTTEFSYLPEGQQKTRTDLVDGVAKRTTTTAYNADYTVRSQVTEHGAKTLAQCNFFAGDPSSGYDANSNLLISRSLKGGSGCDSGNLNRKREFSYDHRDRVSQIVQTVDLPADELGPVARTQGFNYRKDDALQSTNWKEGAPGEAGELRTTRYEHSDGGFMEQVTDWRASASSISAFDYLPSGSVSSINLGSGVATASLGYHRDGSVQKLVWDATDHTSPIRSHTSIAYNVGGLRTQETVAVTHPNTSVAEDPGGTARFTYDLADRLTSWTSPFRLNDDSATDQPKTTYGLDDAGNITSEVVVSDNGTGAKKKETTSVYDNSRLESRTVKTFDLLDGTDSSTTNQSFFYTGLGEEKRRSASTTISGSTVTDETATTYDALGHTNQIDNSKRIDGSAADAEADLDYAYSADRQIVARTKKSATESQHTLYFYWGTTTTIAEETTPAGTTRVRYLVSSGAQVIAEQSYEDDDLVTGEPDQANATFTFLLRDPDGNVATELEADGTIAAQKAYDPYGASDEEGSSSTETETEDDSTLGFQSDHTDEVTGNILLGPRVYDPTTDRFTTPDFFVGSGPDVALGTDPLTGNRYLFAAANPVAFYENGYGVDRGIGVEPYRRERRPQCSRLNCGLLHFESMSIDQRIAWLDDFSARHASQFNAASWFNAIRDVLEFARDENLVVRSRFFSSVDASILHGLQQGMVLAKGGNIGYQDAAASAWESFFLSRRGGASLEESKRLWGVAEQSATEWGIRWAADNALEPSVGERWIMGFANVWRAKLRGENVFAPGAPELYDPRSSGPLYRWAHAIYP